MPLKKEVNSLGQPVCRVPDATGRIAKNPALFERDLAMLKRQMEGATIRDIATEFKRDRSTVSHAIKRALRTWPDAQETADAKRARESAKLDRAEAAVWEVINDPPYSYGSSGKVVLDPRTNEPQRDKSAVLRAANTLVNISRRRASLHGLDTPVESTVRITTDLDREITVLVGELISGGCAEDAARLMLEAVTGQHVVPGELEAGQEAP
jgi:hypothetical protein